MHGIPKTGMESIYTYINNMNVFFLLSAAWHTGSPPGPHTQVWDPAEVRGTCSGGWKWHVHSGRHSEHVEPSRPMQPPTYRIHYQQVKKMSDIWNCPTSHVTSGNLSSISSGITYLVMEKSFSDTNMRPFTFYSIHLRPSFQKLFNYKPTTNPFASLICEIKSNYLMVDQPTTQPIGIFVLIY